MERDEYEAVAIEHWTCAEHPTVMLPTWLRECPHCHARKSMIADAAHDSAAARERRVEPRLQDYPSLVAVVQENAAKLRAKREKQERALRKTETLNSIGRGVLWMVCALFWFIVCVGGAWGFWFLACLLWERGGR